MRNCPDVRGARSLLLLLGAVLVAGLVIVDPAQSATTLYVSPSPSGADSPGCGPQNSPCRNIDYAVNKSSADDTILVAGGTYQMPNTPTCDKNVVCVFNKSITILGGYDAAWNLNPVANPTVIDGQSANRGIYVLGVGQSPRLTMSNVTIQNAFAVGTDAAPGAFGGGMLVDNGAVTLDSVTFLTNQAVGANTNSGQGGSAAGGALAIRSNSAGGPASLLTNVLFQGNKSTAGQGPKAGGVAYGAVFVYASTVDIEDSFFRNNKAFGGVATADDGTISGQHALGGAIGADGGSVITLARIEARLNKAVAGAGAQKGGQAFGGAVYIENSTVTIEDSLISPSNKALGYTLAPGGGFAAGGGVFIFNSAGTINRTQIIANRVTGGPEGGGGGGVYLWRSIPGLALPKQQILNTVIADNKFAGPSGGGGGLRIQGLVVNMRQVTFANNTLGAGPLVGQAMFVVQSDAGPGIANLKWSAVTNHAGTALVVADGNYLTLKRGAFVSNAHDTNADGDPIPPGIINGLGSTSTAPPGTDAGFVSLGFPSYDYHITATSVLRDPLPASNSPVPFDMDGEARDDGLPDWGADEYKP